MLRGRGDPASGMLARTHIESVFAVSRRNVSEGPPGGCAIRPASIEKPVQNISGKQGEPGALARRLLEMPLRAPVVLGDVLPGEVHLDEGYAHSFSSRATAASSVSRFLQNAKRT